MKKYLSLVLFVCAPLIIQAQEASKPKNATSSLLRAEDDYSYLSHVDLLMGLDRIRYIPISKKKAFISLGADFRTEYQSLWNEEWDDENSDPNIIFQRFMVHANFQLNPSFRVFTQLKSGLPYHRNNPIFLDEDHLDFHQLFMEFSHSEWTLQLGRKELWYGARRLISIREGTNVRQSFDGIRLIKQNQKLRFDLLAYVYNPQRPGIFDNRIDREQKLWGGYLTLNKVSNSTSIDLYYLGIHREQSVFDSGLDEELRHSIGFRHFGNFHKFQFNNEFIYQFGEFGNDDISAWTASFDIKYKWNKATDIGLKLDLISGDQNQNDSQLNSFNALYPRGGYFGLLALIGPSNLIDIHPSYGYQISERLHFNFDWDFFWRFEEEDGIYLPSGVLNISNNGSRQRFIGHQAGGQLTFEVNEFIELESSYFHFFNGDFLHDIGRNASVRQFGLSLKVTI